HKKYKSVDLTRGFAAEAKILAALGERTDLDFTDQTLLDVVDYFKERHGIEIQLDAKALADAGIGGATTVTRNGKGASLRSALELLLNDFDLTYLVRDEVLMITTEAQADAIRQRWADEGRGPGEGGDRYARIVENPFLGVVDNPLSTFSIDVDTASY